MEEIDGLVRRCEACGKKTNRVYLEGGVCYDCRDRPDERPE